MLNLYSINNPLKLDRHSINILVNSLSTLSQLYPTIDGVSTVKSTECRPRIHWDVDQESIKTLTTRILIDTGPRMPLGHIIQNLGFWTRLKAALHSSLVYRHICRCRLPLLAIICGHPRFRSIPSQYDSTNWAALRKISGSFAQN